MTLPNNVFDLAFSVPSPSFFLATFNLSVSVRVGCCGCKSGYICICGAGLLRESDLASGLRSLGLDATAREAAALFAWVCWSARGFVRAALAAAGTLPPHTHTPFMAPGEAGVTVGT